jgi:hypothetical protein
LVDGLRDDVWDCIVFRGEFPLCQSKRVIGRPNWYRVSRSSLGTRFLINIGEK